jgi:hypothetical protein
VRGRPEGIGVKIAGMVVWVLTAGIGVYVLVTGIGAQRRGRAAGADAGQLARVAAGAGEQAQSATLVGTAALASGAVPGSAPSSGRAAAEGSPLLEFVHPLLALTGLTFWIFFVMTSYRPFAWVSFGVVVVAILAGVSWVFASRRQRDPGGLRFPPHLVLLHGAAAVCTLALVVIAAVAAR